MKIPVFPVFGSHDIELFVNTEDYPYKKKLSASEYTKVMKFSGVGSVEADDLGMADMAEVEAVKSYVYSNGKYTVKQVS